MAQRQNVKSEQHKNQSDIDGHAGLDLPEDLRPGSDPRVASQDHATAPHQSTPLLPETLRSDIPPPVTSAVEQALSKATDRAKNNAEYEARNAEDTNQEDTSATTLGIPDTYMKYLTFGLSTLGKPATKTRPPSSRRMSTASSKPSQSTINAVMPASLMDDDDDEGSGMMTTLQPMPDGETLKSRIAMQKRLENEGYFVVGLKGDLDVPMGDDEAEATDGSFGNVTEGSRIVLRTVQVKVIQQPTAEDDDGLAARRPSLPRTGSTSEASRGYRRMRALIYAHRPFIYCFLFEANTSSLQYTSFYRTLRQTLMPIHKPLLSSTSAVKVAQRIENSHLDPGINEPDTASITSGSSKNTLPSKSSSHSPIFDLIYDPRLLTVHTSIPNIPEPGTLAAEGIFSTTKTELAVPGWTRVEAMNVHSQILNTLASVKKRRADFERTSKTGRGWWVVWMKVPPSSSSPSAPTIEKNKDEAGTCTDTGANTPTARELPAAAQAISRDLSRIAFLVRRASDAPQSSSDPGPRFVSASSSKAMSTMFSNMTFGLAGGGKSEEDVTGGASAGWGPQALAGGMGVDARRYVEGLLSLGR